MPRLSFSLRDVFWLTLVVACLTAWWLDREQVRRTLRKEADWQRTISEKALEAMASEHPQGWTFRRDAMGELRFRKVGETVDAGP